MSSGRGRRAGWGPDVGPGCLLPCAPSLGQEGAQECRVGQQDPARGQSEEGQVTSSSPVTCGHRPLVPEGTLRSLSLVVPKHGCVIWLHQNQPEPLLTKFVFVTPSHTPESESLGIGVGPGLPADSDVQSGWEPLTLSAHPSRG